LVVCYHGQPGHGGRVGGAGDGRNAKTVFLPRSLLRTPSMRPGRIAGMLARLAWQLRLQLATRHSEATRLAVRMDLGRRHWAGGRVMNWSSRPFLGPRHWERRRKPKLGPKGWIGIYGSARRRSGRSTPSLFAFRYGAGGRISVAAHWATWFLTVSTQFFSRLEAGGGP